MTLDRRRITATGKATAVALAASGMAYRNTWSGDGSPPSARLDGGDSWRRWLHRVLHAGNPAAAPDRSESEAR